jgi:DNA polymerase-3 subunit beta
MEFTCTQENLLITLTHITPLTGKNLSLPILHNILIDIHGGEITLKSTNLEIAIISHLRGKIEKEGSLTVNGKLFFDFINLQPNGKIHVAQKDNDLHITSSSSKTVIKGSPVEEFPLIPHIENKKFAVSVLMQEFHKAILAVLPTISLQESRPEISGLYMEFVGKEMVIVGTDSYRLAEYKLPSPTTDVQGSYIIPLRTIQEINRIFSNGNATLIFTDNQLSCAHEDVELISRLIEGKYPDYRQIIPQEEKTTISFNRQECLQAVKTASLFCKSGVNDVELTTKKSEKLLMIVAANSQVGENISTVPCTITGQDTSIVFNYRYMLDALGTIETENVLLGLTDANSTGMLRPSDTTPLIHLIMPIRQ